MEYRYSNKTVDIWRLSAFSEDYLSFSGEKIEYFPKNRKDTIREHVEKVIYYTPINTSWKKANQGGKYNHGVDWQQKDLWYEHLNNKTSGNVQHIWQSYKSRILSPIEIRCRLLFVIAMMKLSYILRKSNGGYQFIKLQEMINHLMFKDDIDLFAKDVKEFKTPIQKKKKILFNLDIGMEFDIKKCVMHKMKSGKNNGSNRTAKSRENQNARRKGKLLVRENIGCEQHQTIEDERKKWGKKTLDERENFSKESSAANISSKELIPGQ